MIDQLLGMITFVIDIVFCFFKAVIIEVSFVNILIWMLFIAILIMFPISGAMAADIAEAQEADDKKYFWRGFFLPFIYPSQLKAFCVHNQLPKLEKPIKEEEFTDISKIKKKVDFAPAYSEQLEAQQEAEAAKAAAEAEAEAENPPVINRDVIESLPSSDGVFLGPLQLVLQDGTMVSADYVKDVQDDLAVFQINGKSIRLKYKNIQSCEH